MEGIWELGWVGWGAPLRIVVLNLFWWFTDPSENPMSDEVDSLSQKKKSTNTYT